MLHRRRVGVVLACVLWTAVVATDAAAHEGRRVGAYRFVVGWAEEPAFAGFKNAVQLILADGAGKPVRDLGDTLRVEVIFADQRYGPVPLHPAFGATFGTPGDYHASIIPTRPGTYSFRFTGTIKGMRVNETFTSSERTFDPVGDPAGVEFPSKDPSRGELAESVQRVSGRVDAANQAADRASSRAASARTFGLLGLVAGALGLVVALVRGRPAARA